jgi:UDP:flavonoid glycosyltransferase YjiC (YdhE family)
MARFLFVVPPLAGHVNPTVSVAAQLECRGHEVAWAAHTKRVEPLLPATARLLPAADDIPDEIVEAVKERAMRFRGAASLEFLWRDFLIPLALAMAPGVEAAVEAEGTDVVVADQQALAGAVVARRRRMRWATSATTSAELVDPFAGLPKVRDWLRRRTVQLQIDLGINPADAERGDLRFSEHLVLGFTTEDLAGPEASRRPNTALVGPALEARRALEDADASGFPWQWLDGAGPKVLVSLGTVVSARAGERFFTAVIEALAETGIRTVLVAPPEAVGTVPDTVLVRRSVPQLALLERVDAVVCHAGHNTVCESLAKGLPLVVAPIRDDQPVVAEQVVKAKAGIRVRFGRVRPDELRAAVQQVLSQPSYRQAAGRIQASFERAGGARAAADELEMMAT